jgi:hypothetical protein
MGRLRGLSKHPAAFTVFLITIGLGCKRSSPPPRTRVVVAHPAAPATKIAPPTPIQEQKVELGGPTWNPEWDPIIEKSLPPAMLSRQVPRDVRRFCPRFYEMSEVDKRQFWAYFFQALAGAEAGLDASTNVRHTEPEVARRDRVTGQMIHSEGLLQLTYEDEERYGCDFDWKADRNLGPRNPRKTILQPVRNLECGIKILYAQIIAHRKPLLSPTGYWSTLHPANSDFLVFVKQMSNPPAACGLHIKYAKNEIRKRPVAHTAVAAKVP